MLKGLVDRGLDPTRHRLYIMDGGKALHKGVLDVFGKSADIQRCQVHKKRDVLAYLPESEQDNVSVAMTMAYREFDYQTAKSKLTTIGANLEHRYLKAAASLLEGLEETLTVNRLKVPGLLRETLSSTNAMESANSVCRGVIRRATNFKNGEMAIRQAAAGFMEAGRGFRRVRGYRQLPFLEAAFISNHDSNIESITA